MARDEKVTLGALEKAADDLAAARASGDDHTKQAETMAALRRAWRLQEEAAGRRSPGATPTVETE